MNVLLQRISPHRLAPPVRRFCSTSAADSKLVLVNRENGIVRITLNAPDKLNPLTVDMGTQFREEINKLQENPEGIRAVILTGAGKAFSAGGDLQFLDDRMRDSPSRNAQIMRNFYERFLCIRKLPFPTIAAINGAAVGAGLCLSLACDLRVCYSDAKLGVTFSQLGIHPGMGSTHFLPKLIGQQQANKLLLTGELISGQEAHDIGLVLESVDRDEVLPRAEALAKGIGSASPVAVRSCVRTLRLDMDTNLDKALWREADAQSYCYASKDLEEGLNAIKSKRKPSFTEAEGYSESLE
eukprot:gb/GECG01013062.1/.p1 GENE.gb/GECG01013062.1/~~gb/GECG01013062.1/.p1  ORF type:complete len:297 (+),score=32.04 gb/GECG01013062.1/:1-891(+)